MSKDITFTPAHGIGDFVYIKHDEEQKRFMVTGYLVRHKFYVYELQSGNVTTYAYGYELSTTKELMI